MGALTHSIKKSLLVTGAAVVLAAAATLFGGQTAHAAAGGDCSDNSIIKCGVTNAADFVTKARANSPADLQAVYANFNLPTSQYDTFARDAKMGVAKQNGDILVNNQVVARNAWSIGRTNYSYSTPYKVGNTTYYKSQNTDVLKEDNMPAMLWFDAKGKLTAAILTACGNPVGGNSVVPNYTCNQINKTAVSGQDNTYKFTANAPASNGATVSRVVYDFGDGSAQQTRTSVSDAVTHTYTASGDFTAKVTVYFKLPGGQEVSASGSGCATKITVKAPPQVATWQCTALTAAKKDGDDQFAYTFTANASMQNARLVSADFNFGDGKTANGVAAATDTTNAIATDHTYATAGTYTATATLRFQAINNADAQGKSTSVTCTTSVTPTTPVTPTPPAPDLPKTGPAGVAGLFAGTSALGALGYRWRASRRLSKVDGVVDGLLKR